MASLRQVRVAKKLASNSRMSMSQAMLEAGYSKNTAVKPSQLLKSNSFKSLLDKYLPDDLILGSLEEDIKLKPQNRVKELELAMKAKKIIGSNPFEETGKDIIGLVGIVVKKDN